MRPEHRMDAAELEPARRATRQAIGRRLRSQLERLVSEPVPGDWLALLKGADKARPKTAN